MVQKSKDVGLLDRYMTNAETMGLRLEDMSVTYLWEDSTSFLALLKSS